MRRVKMAAAHEGKSVKEFLVNLAQARLEELEKKGILPKSKQDFTVWLNGEVLTIVGSGFEIADDRSANGFHR